MPDEFAAEVVRGAVLNHILEAGEDGKFMVGVLQASTNTLSESAKEDLKKEFQKFNNWQKALSRMPANVTGQRPGIRRRMRRATRRAGFGGWLAATADPG